MLVRRFRALTLVAALFTVAAACRAAGPDQGARPSPRRSSSSASTSATTTSSPPTISSSSTGRRSTRNRTGCRSIEIGKTEEGRPHLAAIVTAPENFAKLDRYKQIAQQLHRARGLTDEQARALAKEGKAVVWIDGGLHATEVVGAHQLIETVYQLVSRTDDETTRILRDVIVIAVHANPDGMQMVSKCYMQNADPLQRRTCSPRLYNKYAGHDNNRDFYMSNLKESQNMNKLMYWEWLPQIMYNHHQTGPAGTVIFSPPFRDPFNYNFDPMIVTGLDMVGAAMHHRFLQEGKPGFTMRSGSSYSTWWNGGLRTTAYFQNIIGLLTEIIGNPTPTQIPPTPSQILPRADLPAPIEPQEWHFRQSIDYSVTANYAVLDLASRYKDQFLYNIYKMGANQIERGSRDHWTISNEDMTRLQAAMAPPAPAAGAGGRRRRRRARRRRRGGAAAAAAGGSADAAPGGGGGRGGRGGLAIATYNVGAEGSGAARSARLRDSRRTRPTSPTATKFINTLRYIGVEVHQATAPLTVNGKTYPAGSYVVKTAQAGRAHVHRHVRAAGSPQRHGRARHSAPALRQRRLDARLPDGREVRPALGRRDRSAAGRSRAWRAPLPGTITRHRDDRGLSAVAVDQRRVHDRQPRAEGQRRGLPPRRADDRERQDLSGRHAATSRRAPRRRRSCRRARRSSASTWTRPRPPRPARRSSSPRRIALWDTATGSMPSGWTRFLLERFEFPFTVVCGAGLRRHGAPVEVRRDRHAVGRGVPRRRWRRPRRRRWWRR